MAERLEVDPYTASQPPYRHYPWTEWEDGSQWRIQFRQDFDMEPVGMRNYLYARAKRIGRAVTVSVQGDAIVFQFRGQGEAPARLVGAPARGRPRRGVSPSARASAKRWFAEQREAEYQRKFGPDPVEPEVEDDEPVSEIPFVEPSPEAVARAAAFRAQQAGASFRNFKPEPVSPEARYDD